MNSLTYRSEVRGNVFGHTQRTLSVHPFWRPIDFALFDVPHAQLEYHHIFPQIQLNALITIDDINFDRFARLAEDDVLGIVDIGNWASSAGAQCPRSLTGADWCLEWHDLVWWPMQARQPGSGVDVTARGNGADSVRLGGSEAEEWATWSDDSDAPLSCRRLDTFKPRDFGDGQFLYGARAYTVPLLDGRIVGMLASHSECETRQQTADLQIIEGDIAKSNLLRFEPDCTYGFDALDRQFRIALNQISYMSSNHVA